MTSLMGKYKKMLKILEVSFSWGFSFDFVVVVLTVSLLGLTKVIKLLYKKWDS